MNAPALRTVGLVPDHPVDDGTHSGQLRLAVRLIDEYAGQLLYVHGLGWHHWDNGQRWAEDDRGAAMRAVKDVIGRALLETIGARDEFGTQLRKDARRCETAAGMRGVLDIAATLEPFAATVADLDADPYLLNCANGTLDLRTMEFRDHDPADRITKVTRAAYVAGADTSVWDDFVTSVLPDHEVGEFVQRLIGLSLLGKVREHILAILSGSGANGKSTTLKAIMWALGDYAGTAEADLFMARDGAHPTGEMDLRGLRLAVVSESDRDRKLAEATMKRLTGGDTIKARRMRENFVEFEPSHTPFLITNFLPRVSGDDDAIWRRLRVVPFNRVFSAAEQDHGLDDQLRLAADSVLAWAIRGYSNYAANGLADPPAVTIATSTWQRHSDTVARYLDERCLIATNYRANTTAELHADYEAWARTEGTDSITQKAFAAALDKRGFTVTKSNGRKIRNGIALTTDEPGQDE